MKFLNFRFAVESVFKLMADVVQIQNLVKMALVTSWKK